LSSEALSSDDEEEEGLAASWFKGFAIFEGSKISSDFCELDGL